MDVLKFAVTSTLAVIAILAGLYYFWYNKQNKRLVVRSRASRLLAERISATENIEVNYNGSTVENPYIVTVELVNTGHKDIGSKDFDGDKPLAIKLNSGIVAVLRSEGGIIDHVIDGDKLLIPPTLLARERAYAIRMLASGRPKVAVEPDRLLDTTVLTQDELEQQARKRDALVSRLSIGTAFLTLVALLTNMAGSIVQSNRRQDAIEESNAALREVIVGLADHPDTIDFEQVAAHLDVLENNSFAPVWGNVAGVGVLVFGLLMVALINYRPKALDRF